MKTSIRTEIRRARMSYLQNECTYRRAADNEES